MLRGQCERRSGWYAERACLQLCALGRQSSGRSDRPHICNACVTLRWTRSSYSYTLFYTVLTHAHYRPNISATELRRSNNTMLANTLRLTLQYKPVCVCVCVCVCVRVCMCVQKPVPVCTEVMLSLLCPGHTEVHTEQKQATLTQTRRGLTRTGSVLNTCCAL